MFGERPGSCLASGVWRIHWRLISTGYTRDMLLTMLRALGFGGFDWWKHDLPDASNGWMKDDIGDRIAISLNVAAEKMGDPVVGPAKLLDELMADRLQSFDRVLARLVADRCDEVPRNAERDPLLAQRLHMLLIEARMRILYLEDELRSVRPVPGD